MLNPVSNFSIFFGRVLQERKKYVVTVGEIFRRVKAPESLNISLLAPILRKAKAKNGSQYLRQKLQMIGVELQHGRRKTAQCTLFTSLTEGRSELSRILYSFRRFGLDRNRFLSKSPSSHEGGNSVKRRIIRNLFTAW